MARVRPVDRAGQAATAARPDTESASAHQVKSPAYAVHTPFTAG
jgi:hypothetical protein